MKRLKILSGGQTGVDIAAWRAAKAEGLETGGWMPKGFRTEDGDRPEYAELYGAQETASRDYPPRTALNVKSTPITVFIGTDLESRGARATYKAYRDACTDPDDKTCRAYTTVQWPPESVPSWDSASCVAWLARILQIYDAVNIAGNRDKDLEAPVEAFLRRVFAEVKRLKKDDVEKGEVSV